MIPTSGSCPTPFEGPSDSDVQLASPGLKQPSDSDVTLIKEDTADHGVIGSGELERDFGARSARFWARRPRFPRPTPTATSSSIRRAS